MYNSIKYFAEDCIKNFEKLENEFMRDPRKLAEYVNGVTQELNNLGLRMIQETLESMDEMLNTSAVRRKDWIVERHEKKQIIVSLGVITFNKTLFKNRWSGKSEYLLDRIIGFSKHQRLSEDAQARLLKEAVQTSYRRGGEEASLMAGVSKQTVKNQIHKLKFPADGDKASEKKEVDYLYLEADEDHVSLQFQKKKGDLIENENHQKNNCLITKLVYVHEGIEKEAPKSKRHRLVNPYYFSCAGGEKSNEELWDEVYQYIDSHYELSKVKKIYLNADGGSWIEAGRKRLANVIFVLDGFHLEKYIMRMTSHLRDNREDTAKEIREAIRHKTKADFEELADRAEACLKDDRGLKRVREARRYIGSNWMAAKLRLRHQEGVVGSSTEGHVSHLLSERMSSRPMGWSICGANKMAQLRAYDKNGGDMLELVRYQEKTVPRAAGAEYDNILSSTQIRSSEQKRHSELQKYVEVFSHPLSLEAKKRVYFNRHIWGL